ncbi:hypothetical protein [Clavibacter tessellarius]|uniref:hypothetical protein n=1 Tax=Clavibacter tessellarius TaxID=31965 RepID=UPI003252A4FC
MGVELDEDEWVRRRRASMTVRPQALEAVARAREAGRITLLTNNNALAARHLPTLAPEARAAVRPRAPADLERIRRAEA